MTISIFPTGHQANLLTSDLRIGLIGANFGHCTHWAASGLPTSYLWHLLLRMVSLNGGAVCAGYAHNGERVIWTNTGEHTVMETFQNLFYPFPTLKKDVGLINRKISNITLTSRQKEGKNRRWENQKKKL